MFDRNFWTWLLTGMQEIIMYVLVTVGPLHAPMGLTSLVVLPAFYSALLLYVVFGGFLHLQLGATLMGLVFVMEVGRTAYAAWKWIKGIIL